MTNHCEGAWELIQKLPGQMRKAIPAGELESHFQPDIVTKLRADLQGATRLMENNERAMERIVNTARNATEETKADSGRIPLPESVIYKCNTLFQCYIYVIHVENICDAGYIGVNICRTPYIC
jgi:hypothetical protein